MRLVTVDDLPVPFLRCRAFGHKWEEFVPVGKRTAEFGFRFSLLCVSCGTERHDLIDVHGDVQHRHYTYPDGYQLDVKTNRQEVRLIYERKRVKRRRARRGELEIAV